MAESEIDDERIAAVCRVMNEHRVEFIVIGGVAARPRHRPALEARLRDQGG